ncbi:ribonuclease Z [archaeon]|jgi:ribonuclease Z|nr:ribonuclease Z [archaeon]MBT6762737.1 ribonuclease Z [archaeon]
MSTMKVTFLGTTCMQPTKERNHSGIHVSFGSENLLFDCGEGIQRQMKIAGLKRSKITRIFISHWHGDHALGLAGLISTMAADQVGHTLDIYGPKGSRKKFNHFKKAFPSMNGLPHKLHEVSAGGVILEGKDFIVTAEPLSHSVDCVGFSLKEKDRLKIDMKKAKKAGLVQGPMLAEIQAGKNVRASGKLVKSKNVTSLVVGRKFAYVPDTRPCAGARSLAKNCDALIIESTFLFEDKKLAVKYDHMTAKESAELATKAGALQVYLTHPSIRYRDVSVLLKEAKKYHKKVKFAEDFMSFEV